MSSFTIAQKSVLTKRIAEFTLVATGDDPLPAYTPGAHIDVATTSGSRSYSLIDWPDDDSKGYRIAVQCEQDGEGGSRAMHALDEGAAIEVSQPANDFELVETTKPVALIAGGIGVTPLISMATALQSAGREFQFHYSGRSANEMAYLRQIQTAFGDAVYPYFDDTAPLDLTTLMQGLSGHILYLCGPKGMIDAARTAAEAAGISPEDIHVELFTTAKAEDGDRAFEIEIASTGQIITVKSDQTIVEALEDAGLDPMYDCQRGDCGICQTIVVSGTPDHRDVVLSQSERDSGTVMQICVSRALSDRLVLDL